MKYISAVMVFLCCITFGVDLTWAASSGSAVVKSIADTVIETMPTKTGFTAKTDNGCLSVEFEDSRIVRVRYTRGETFSTVPSLMRVSYQGDAGKIKFEDKKDFIRIKSSDVTVSIDRKTSAVSFYDLKGNLIATEKIDAPRSLEKAVVDQKVPDPLSYQWVDTVDGRRQVATRFESKPVEVYSGRLAFEWVDGEALYGLGNHEEDTMNLRGSMQYLYQHNMKKVIPMLTSTRGYGLLFDAYCNMEFHDDQSGSFMRFDAVDELDYYFIYGPELKQVISGYRRLTGKAPMLAKWAFGYVQSKERYQSQEEIVATAGRFREKHIPIDLIVQDWKYWPGDMWSPLIWDKKRYPDPAGMCKALHDMNVKIMISIWPTIRGGPNEKELKRQGLFLADTSIVDAFRPEARAFYWKCVNENLFSKGIDAWWTDSSEPEVADWGGSTRPQNFNQMNIEKLQSVVGPQRMNAYPLEHARGIWENQRKVTDKIRVVSLTRSAYAGIQRYGAITWSGDISANWETLAQQIPAGLNFCAAGDPYWTVDIGAFFARPRYQWFGRGRYPQGCNDMGYRELYTRWFQYGAFLPVFRSHGTDTPREPWQFGDPGSPFYDAILDMLHLRYRLMPYIYSSAGAVAQEDDTLMRPLAFDLPNDPKVYNIKDQYMFGPALMVCPVTKPMYYQPESVKLEGVARERNVYLPGRVDWIDFWTGHSFKGGQTITAEAPINRIPLYVRGGSIVPTGPDMEYATEKPADPLEIRVYPGADGDFNLYEDENDNYNYEKGAFSLISFQWNDKKGMLTIGERKGTFEGMLKERTFRIVLVKPGSGAGIPLTQKADKEVRYTGKSVQIKTR